jgi:hypothetical protein
MGTVATRFDVTACLDAMSAIEADLNDLVAALTEAQFQAPPRSGGWSVGYCIEHLVLTGRTFLSSWAAVVQGGPVRTVEEIRYNWLHRTILRMVEPPYWLRMKAPQTLAPYSRRSRDETIHRFVNMHQGLARQVGASGQIDLKHTKIQSPFSSLVSYPLGFAVDVVLAHERRHLWQARRVRGQLLDQR